MKNIGIDIGGTFIKSAIVDKKGKVIISAKTPTPKNGKDIPSAVIAACRSLVLKANISWDEINSVGIGTTGVCDSARGIVISSPNIANYDDTHICKEVNEALGKSTFLDNDANCAALGEYIVSEDKPESFIFITLGTGVGGGIILSGKILRGINCGGGEIGHVIIQKDGEKCNCGRCGCWERYASVSALVRQTKNAGITGEVDGRTAFNLAEKGDERAIKVLDKWVEYVAEGVCDMVNIFQPGLVVIGGGVSREGDKILNPIKKFVSENSMTGKISSLPQTKIQVSKLFNDAGVVG
ncbi:MAG: ROK family protein, partial [Clostridia bacterium]|nr:ROK family protein [Clostridia bacterium]